MIVSYNSVAKLNISCGRPRHYSGAYLTPCRWWCFPCPLPPPPHALRPFECTPKLWVVGGGCGGGIGGRPQDPGRGPLPVRAPSSILLCLFSIRILLIFFVSKIEKHFVWLLGSYSIKWITNCLIRAFPMFIVDNLQ